MTEVGWRWTFLLPAPIALAVLLAGIKLIPQPRPARRPRSYDIAGRRHQHARAAAARLHGRLRAARSAGPRRARSARSRVVDRAGRRVRDDRAAGRAPAAAARHPAQPHGARGGPGGDGRVRLLHRLPVHRHACTCSRCCGWSPAEHGAGLPAGRPDRRLRRAAHRARWSTGSAPAGWSPSASSLSSSATRCSCGSAPTPNYAPTILPSMLLLGLGFALSFPALNIQATTGVGDDEQGLAVRPGADVVPGRRGHRAGRGDGRAQRGVARRPPRTCWPATTRRWPW